MFVSISRFDYGQLELALLTDSESPLNILPGVLSHPRIQEMYSVKVLLYKNVLLLRALKRRTFQKTKPSPNTFPVFGGDLTHPVKC